MSGNTKALRNRIKSVSSTLQLTKAMGLVASGKIRRANERMAKAREYIQSLEAVLSILAKDPEVLKSPFLRQREGSRACILVISGDRGLAGGYNANVFRLAAEYPDAEWIPVGKRAGERFGGPVCSSEHFSVYDANELACRLCDEYLQERWDRFGILDTEYVSAMSQVPRLRWILPFAPVAPSMGDAVVEFEPDAPSVLARLAREYVAGRIVASLRESFACEVTARRMAMDSAGKNAKEMIDRLQLEYNRARQGSITQEITEIVAGSGT